MGVEFLTNGGAEDMMHVLVQALVEVGVAVEIPLEDKALSMLGPQLKVAGQSYVATLMRFLGLVWKLLKAWMLNMTCKAVYDVITLMWWLEKDVKTGMCDKTNMLIMESLSKKAIE